MSRLLFIMSFFLLHVNANMLQKTIDNAPSGSTIKLSEGTYSGNIVINKPITILGQEKSTVISGESKDNVITINSSDVTLENLKIIKSGNRLEKLDSAIFIKNAKNVNIKNCTN